MPRAASTCAPARATEAGHPVLHVGDEALTSLFTVVADVDSGLDLCSDAGCCRGLHCIAQLAEVDVLPAASSAVQLGQVLRPGKTARMRRQQARVTGQHAVSLAHCSMSTRISVEVPSRSGPRFRTTTRVPA